MTLLSRKSDYALLILLHLHQNPDGACAREIAERYSLSRAFVANILKELCHKGFVTSHRGVNGGYVLLRSAEEVRLAEVISSLDDSFRLTNCNHDEPEDSCQLTNRCPIKAPMANINARIVELLNSVTLAELFRPSSGGDSLLTVTVPTRTPSRGSSPALVEAFGE
jgi:Rrf2 family protein